MNIYRMVHTDTSVVASPHIYIIYQVEMRTHSHIIFCFYTNWIIYGRLQYVIIGTLQNVRRKNSDKV